MNPTRRGAAVTLLATLLLPLGGLAQPIDAPNFIPISPLLATSGQPTEDALRALGTRGFRAVVYLAPGNVANAVHAEAELLAAQGIEFIPIPIPFGAPEHAHVQAVFAALNRLRDRKTLVHCEINMRASTLVFLYRAIELRDDPASAYQAVAQVWSPRGVWRRLVVDELAASDLQFDPY